MAPAVEHMHRLAATTNPGGLSGSLVQAPGGADVFIRVSGARVTVAVSALALVNDGSRVRRESHDVATLIDPPRLDVSEFADRVVVRVVVQDSDSWQ